MPQTIGRIPNRIVSITSVTKEYLEVPSTSPMQTPARITTPNTPRITATTTCSFSLTVIGYPSPADACPFPRVANVDEAREQCKWSWYGCDLLDQDIWLCYHAAQPWSQVWLHDRQAYWSQGYAGGRANWRAVMEVQQAHWERTVASGQGPAYRIHTQRLVLRCWQPTDAPLL